MAKKNPVPKDPLECYAGIVLSLSDVYGVRDIPEIFRCVEMLFDAIKKYRAAEESGTLHLDAEENASRKFFIAKFMESFKKTYGMEYPGKITPADSRIIGQILNRLKDIGVPMSDYISWVFDVWLSENPRFRLTHIKTLGSDSFINGFAMYAHETGLDVRRREESRRALELQDIETKVRCIKRVYGGGHPDVIEKLKRAVELYRENKVNGKDLINALDRLESNLALAFETSSSCVSEETSPS